jgi:predicted transcriptional regulator
VVKKIMITVSSALRTLADPKIFAILENIAFSDIDRDFLFTHLNLSNREYYSRISCLLKNGIITKSKGKFSLTSFGRVVCNAQNLIGIALTNYWKLSAIDSLDSSRILPSTEYCNILNSLVSDERIKEVLTSGRTPKPPALEQLVENTSPSLQSTSRWRPER